MSSASLRTASVSAATGSARVPSPPVLYFDDRYHRWTVKTLLRDGVDVKTFRARRKAEQYQRRMIGTLPPAARAAIQGGGGYDTSDDFSSFSFSSGDDGAAL